MWGRFVLGCIAGAGVVAIVGCVGWVALVLPLIDLLILAAAVFILACGALGALLSDRPPGKPVLDMRVAPAPVALPRDRAPPSDRRFDVV